MDEHTETKQEPGSISNRAALDELYAAAVEKMRAMLPILAAELGVKVGEVSVVIHPRHDWAGVTVFDDSDPQNMHRNATGYSWRTPMPLTAALDELIAERAANTTEAGHD